MNEAKLPACPFCKLTDKDTVSPDMGLTPAVALHEYSSGVFRVECEGCGCKGPLADSAESALSQWAGDREQEAKQNAKALASSAGARG